MNRVVEMVLRCIMHDSKELENWETILAIAEFVINNPLASSTGYTPFYLNYSYHPCTLVDVPRDAEETTIENVNQFTLRMQRHFHKPNSFFTERKNGRKSKPIGGNESGRSTWETRYF